MVPCGTLGVNEGETYMKKLKCISKTKVLSDSKKVACILICIATLLLLEIVFIISDDNGHTQWALKNTGKFEYELCSTNSWGIHKPKMMKNVDIKYSQGIGYFKQRRTVKIAVIDGSVNLYSKYLDKKKLWHNNNEMINGLDDDKNGYVDDINGWNFRNHNNVLYNNQCKSSHGMSVVSLLIGNKLSYTSILEKCNCKVINIKILSEDDSGNLNDLINAIQYAEKNGAKICNLSLCGCMFNQKLKSVMENSDMLFVVSAGNFGEEIKSMNSFYPVSYDLNNMITVADLRSDGNLSETSNYGQKFVDIAAPGTDILSIDLNGTLDYFSGTTYAAVYVTGAATLLYCSSHSILSPEMMKTKILKASSKMNSLNGKVKCGGMLNLKTLLSNQ